jgi:hypothetical protein
MEEPSAAVWALQECLAVFQQLGVTLLGSEQSSCADCRVVMDLSGIIAD